MKERWTMSLLMNKYSPTIDWVPWCMPVNIFFFSFFIWNDHYTKYLFHRWFPMIRNGEIFALFWVLFFYFFGNRVEFSLKWKGYNKCLSQKCIFSFYLCVPIVFPNSHRQLMSFNLISIIKMVPFLLLQFPLLYCCLSLITMPSCQMQLYVVPFTTLFNWYLLLLLLLFTPHHQFYQILYTNKCIDDINPNIL